MQKCQILDNVNKYKLKYCRPLNINIFFSLYRHTEPRFSFMAPNFSTLNLGILSNLGLSTPSGASGVILNQSSMEDDSSQPQTVLNRDGMNCYLFSLF